MSKAAKAKAKRLMVAVPNGFCSGVERAVRMAGEACRGETGGGPVYCLHQLVHNDQVCAELTASGMIFVDSLDAVPPHRTVMFSAHGVPPDTRDAARQRGLTVVDATCPYVLRLHAEVRRFAAAGLSVILIGDRGHQEVRGVVGEAPDRVTVAGSAAEAEALQVADPEKVAVVTQTTLGLDEAERIMAVLRRRFPTLRESARSNICRATGNRQRAVAALAGKCDLILVLGSPQSANSRRLVETAAAGGCQARLVSDPETLRQLDLGTANIIGLTSGASTPDTVLRQAVAILAGRGFRTAAKARPINLPTQGKAHD